MLERCVVYCLWFSRTWQDHQRLTILYLADRRHCSKSYKRVEFSFITLRSSSSLEVRYLAVAASSLRKDRLRFDIINHPHFPIGASAHGMWVRIRNTTMKIHPSSFMCIRTNKFSAMECLSTIKKPDYPVESEWMNQLRIWDPCLVYQGSLNHACVSSSIRNVCRSSTHK